MRDLKATTCPWTGHFIAGALQKGREREAGRQKEGSYWTFLTNWHWSSWRLPQMKKLLPRFGPGRVPVFSMHGSPAPLETVSSDSRGEPAYRVHRSPTSPWLHSTATALSCGSWCPNNSRKSARLSRCKSKRACANELSRIRYRFLCQFFFFCSVACTHCEACSNSLDSTVKKNHTRGLIASPPLGSAAMVRDGQTSRLAGSFLSLCPCRARGRRASRWWCGAGHSCRTRPTTAGEENFSHSVSSRWRALHPVAHRVVSMDPARGEVVMMARERQAEDAKRRFTFDAVYDWT